MSGQRGVDGNFRGFVVADFADHNDVGVLAQQRPQAVGKSVADFRVDLALVNVRDAVFNRVFNGGNVYFRGVKQI